MKRFLSLVLTLVMVMSLVTVSAGAKDFTDDDKITYDEAVAVVSEVGIVDGYADGAFNPSNTLTRQAAAKIICNLILGPTTAAELHADTAPYRDVPVNSEFAGYIAYCQAKGIISGYADGSFRPGGTLTGYAFMKMLLGALGYDATLESYVGSNWSINVAKQALGIGLNAGLEGEFNGIKAVTREEACLYAFNTLQADLVEYGQRLTTNINGTEVTLSSGGAQSRTWKSQQTRVATIRDDEIVQFAEEYFSKLVKSPDSDKFMRPSHTWVYDKKIQIGTWLDQDKLLETYTTGVTGRDLYDLLGSVTIRDFDLEVYVDGHEANNTTGTVTTDYTQYQYAGTDEEITAAEMKRSNTDDLGITGDGVLTEIFIDKDNELITITSIHTWLAQATTTYNADKETASVKVHMYYTGKSNGSLDLVSQTKTVALDDVPEVADVTADTFYLVRMSDKDTTKLEVADMGEPEILEQSTVTKFSLSTKFGQGQDGLKYPTKLTTGGNEYADSDRACYDVDVLDQYDNDLLTTNTYNVYLDKYGYFIGIDLFEGTKQYVFVTGYDMRNSNLSIQTASAAGIFLDGTMQNITVNVKDTNSNIKNMVTDKSHGGVNDALTNEEYANANAYYQKWGTNTSDGVYLLNRWYTYTVTEAGVYTLKPCVDKNGVAMMLASKTDDVTTGDASELKLNCAKLRLDGVEDSGEARDGDLLIGETMQYTKGTGTGAGKVLTTARAYGEDESVFITVDVDEVSASAGGAVGSQKLDITKAITDVNGVYTGVQDVDIITRTTNRVQGKYYVNNTDKGAGPVATAAIDTHAADDQNGHWVTADGTDSYLGENAYAVFDKNHFIIGAVILGEAEGNNATKAYILDPVKYERYENGTYYWQFEAVINGEIVKQEAESKFASTIDTMRENQYEVVELRYKAADSEIVTDVKEIECKDTDATTAADKIYGYPFGEILTTGHKVKDNESVYDVVLTGAEDDAVAHTTTFKGVTRPRTNTQEHPSSGRTFVATQEGTLRLQGRTLYVLDGQHDYGIDFVRDAKAVVRQREGYLDASNSEVSSWENRAYTSVQEAIDSLGDPNTATGEKEFRGIITAVLNSQGVAEWVVFYSDTLAETKNNTSVSGATIELELWVELPGFSAQMWEKRTVARPADGTDQAIVTAPVVAGYTPVNPSVTIKWNKNLDGSKMIFQYTGSASTPEDPTDDTRTVRVQYVTGYNSTPASATGKVGTQDVTVPLSAAGYGTLAESLLEIPDGFKLKAGANTPGTDTDLGKEIEKATTPLTLSVTVEERSDVTKVEILNAPTALDLLYNCNAAAVAAAADDAGIKVKITYKTGDDEVSRTVDANDAGLTWDAAGTTNPGTTKVTHTASSVASTTIPTELYAAVAAGAFTAATGSQIATGFTAASNPALPISKVKVGDTITITFTQTTAADLTFGATRAVTPTGGTIETLTADDWAVTNGAAANVGAGTEAVNGVVSVTITVATITAAAFSAEVSVS